MAVQEQFLTVDDSDMRVLSALPDSAGPHPVYIECYHAPGQDGFTEQVLTRMAENGYAAFSHHLFHRQGPDAKGRDAIGLATDEEFLRDTEALLAHVESLDSCDTARRVIGGHCMGGRVSLLAAASIGGFKAAADFWGGNVMTAKGREAPTVLDLVKQLDCPVIGFFGNDDDNPSPADANRLDEELTAQGIEHAFHRYDGAGHAFQNFLNDERYREVAAEDAWAKVIAFFGEKIA
jgi:carboxymethylenebutenolidase